MYPSFDLLKGLIFLQDRINRLFEERLKNVYAAEDIDEVTVWCPSVDIYETEKDFVLTAEIPGVMSDNVNVEVVDNEMIMQGYRPFPKEGLKKENYLRLECGYGHFERKFILPVSVDEDMIKAELKDGVLKVLIPKTPVHKITRIEIEDQ